MSKHGYDSIALSAAEWRQIVPGNPEVVAGYLNGRWPSFQFAKEAFPKALHLSYDVNGSRADADILDVESGDASPAQCPAWFRAHRGKTLPKPAFYCSASVISSVVSALLDDGIKRDQFLIQSAHYTREHVCSPLACGYPQADATQYADHGTKGQNTDLSVFDDHFFAGKAPDPDARYGWFDGTRRSLIAHRSERDVVKEYDRWRGTQTRTHHPHRLRLALLRAQLWALARRLDKIIAQGGAASFHRGWRRRELRDRAQGKRLV